MTRTRDRKCGAYGCHVRVPERFLMCMPHWFLLSEALQDRIGQAYRFGQTALTASQEYKAAVFEARDFVQAWEVTFGPVTNTKHRCLITGCRSQIPVRALVCRRDWLLLPKQLRHDVLDLRPAAGRDLAPGRAMEVLGEATAAVRAAETR